MSRCLRAERAHQHPDGGESRLSPNDDQEREEGKDQESGRTFPGRTPSERGGREKKSSNYGSGLDEKARGQKE